MELDAHVDDRHDDAAQIDHAFDELRRIGDTRHVVVAADFLHLENVDAVLFGAEREDEEFLTAGVCLLRVAAAIRTVAFATLELMDWTSATLAPKRLG
jgi:hypothetical protein